MRHAHNFRDAVNQLHDANTRGIIVGSGIDGGWRWCRGVVKLDATVLCGLLSPPCAAGFG